MKYFITNADETHAICYADSDFNTNITRYKWGDIEKCYLWQLDYNEAIALMHRLHEFAIKSALPDASHEWAARVMVIPSGSPRGSVATSSAYNSPYVYIGRV